MIDAGLTGRVAMVTGSNSPLGIGAAVARALGREGARVALAFLPTAAPPERQAGEPVEGPVRTRTSRSGEVSYGATKYALESLSRSAAQEMASAGITVNTIAPGPVQNGWISAEMREEADTLSPFGRVGRPDDIADIAVFRASEQARWVSGQTIYAGGGKRMY
jgi:NAD(P)-dependent dehydrogenase (short-subunit alcohol dehydrogenase family)